MLDVIGVMRRVPLCMLEGGLGDVGRGGGGGGDPLYATLYSGGCGGWALLAGGDALCATPYAGRSGG